MSPIFGLAREHGVAAKSGGLYFIEYVARGRRPGERRYLEVQVLLLRYSRRVLLVLLPRYVSDFNVAPLQWYESN